MTRRTGRPQARWTRWWLPVTAVLAVGLFFAYRWLRDTGVLFTLIGVPAPGRPCGGAIMPPPQVAETNVIPVDKLYVGDAIHITARVEGYMSPGQVRLISHQFDYPLYDDGTHGDAIGGDANWSLDLPWRESYGTGKQRLRVQLQLPGYMLQNGSERELTILTKGEAGSSGHTPTEPK
jgi:hypothetical protein